MSIAGHQLSPAAHSAKRQPADQHFAAFPDGLGDDDADEENIAYLKQLSREVTALEMLKHELLERNARLERWHLDHPNGVPPIPATTSQAPQGAEEQSATTDKPSCSGEAPTQPESPLLDSADLRRSPRNTQSPSCGLLR
ncbi:hypothetical protein COCSUDRAFT_60318 [Coccomyxa subellipsoidea C-169]|uniref:Uncharacterized protein n=1 Tax=Coccomyxa subellipsoidea (strain C-169) TaxID=574566 RepID=I0YIY2_COCSC|nr:hypothetical protein COCSUDRAFT_60318 [Coccomyxa subellipsoidea C-169]EIE18351.1 hypothetical protein COCSUDRAFT_60318 [Coccomyxa subellipsoidea C-169]|eukprot:XP_005642895.1 hypothetical protein COCSUDRAFT_60318 [Coccomyxa subellipsoidea C-169]